MGTALTATLWAVPAARAFRPHQIPQLAKRPKAGPTVTQGTTSMGAPRRQPAVAGIAVRCWPATGLLGMDNGENLGGVAGCWGSLNIEEPRRLPGL